jgi:hypothetical protein
MINDKLTKHSIRASRSRRRAVHVVEGRPGRQALFAEEEKEREGLDYSSWSAQVKVVVGPKARGSLVVGPQRKGVVALWENFISGLPRTAPNLDDFTLDSRPGSVRFQPSKTVGVSLHCGTSKQKNILDKRR